MAALTRSGLVSIRASRCALTPALLRPAMPALHGPSALASRPSRSPLACNASSAAQPSGDAPPSSSRHAVLHDFCMVIPFSAVSIGCGIALFFLKLTTVAGAALIAGATALVAAVLSLQEWKAGGDSKTYTLTSAASAAAVAYITYSSLNVLVGGPYWVSLVLCCFSVAAAAFCAYNVLAGGNPPPKPKKDKKEKKSKKD